MLRRKHIKAPTRFDPGPGHPTEHLAYLSPAEMEMLRVLTDGTVTRGPKGLPSFVYSDSQTAKSGPMGSGSFSVTPKAGSAAINSGSGSNSGGGSKSSGAGGVSASPKSSTSMAAAKPSAAPSAPAKPSGGGSSAPAKKTATAPVSGPSGGPPKGPGASMAAAKASMAPPVAAKPSFTPPGQRSSTFGQAAGKARTQNVTRPAAAAAAAPAKPALSQQQAGAYKQFGQLMSGAPRQNEVMRSPGDAESLARMAIAESGIIRDKDTGKMNLAGAQAVMNVIRNRMENQQQTVDGVINQRSQFSPWSDGKFSKTQSDPAYTALAEAVLQGKVPDITKGADVYHNATTVNGTGFKKASAETRNRINNNFTPTLTINDGVNPSVYGHQFGVNKDGTKASQKGPSPMKVAPGSPVSLPPGAMSPDPNYGKMISAPPAQVPTGVRVPGRFGGFKPDPNAPTTEKISYQAGQPVPTYGALFSNEPYQHRFEDNNEVPDPNHFSNDPQVLNLYNKAGVPMANLGKNRAGKTFNPGALTPTAQRLYQGLVDTALRTGKPITFFSGNDGRGINHIGHAMDIHMNDPVTGMPLAGDPSPKGANHPAKGQYTGFARDTFDTLYQNPDVYGGIGPITRWGGMFNQGVPDDLMHFDTTPRGGFSGKQTAMHQAAASRAANAGRADGGFALASYNAPPLADTAPGFPVSASPSFVPRPTPRPFQAGLSRNAFDTGRSPAQFTTSYGEGQRTRQVGAPAGPAEYDTARGGVYTGYGTFNPPRQPSKYSGYGATPPAGKKIHDRVPQEQGPQKPPDYAGKKPAGTYTASYDVKPPKGPALKGSDKLDGLPPGYAERYGLGGSRSVKPADPKKEEKKQEQEDGKKQKGGWLQAGFDLVDTGVKKVQEKKQQVDQAVKENEGKLKVLSFMDKLFGPGWMLSNGGSQSKFPSSNSKFGEIKNPRARAAIVNALAKAVETMPQVSYQPPPNTFLSVEDRDAVMRRLLGENWT